MNETKKRGNANLPALILLAVLLMFWQAAAMGIDAAYILPSPTQILVRLWELRGPLFTAHLPATMSVVAIGLSISIASNLAKGYDLDTAVERAKAYISGALAAMLDLGQGSGPMDHGFDFRGKGFAEEKA